MARGIRHLLVLAVAIGLAASAEAAPIVLDFDGVPPASFQTADYTEDGARIQVVSGHYDIFVSGGDNYFNLDQVNFGFSEVVLTLDSGLPFDVIEFDVVDPASSVGEYTITAIGGGGGSISAPTSTGLFSFGPGFEGIDALVIKQNSSGFFGFDDLKVRPIPEPNSVALFGLGALLAARSVRRSRQDR